MSMKYRAWIGWLPCGAALLAEEAGPDPAEVGIAVPTEVLQEVNGAWWDFWGRSTAWLQLNYPHILWMLGGIAVSILIGMLINWIFAALVVRRLARRTRTRVDDLLCEALRPAMSGVVVTLGIYLSVLIVLGQEHGAINAWGLRIFFAVEAAMIFWALWRGLNVVQMLLRDALHSVSPEMDELGLSLINTSLKVTLLIIEVLFIGQTILGMDISAMIAGAGVVGLAVALASRESVANFFGSLMLALDRPFAVGDRVRSPGVDGMIERVGFRSTAIRQLSGCLYTVPNSMISGIGIENVSRQAFQKHVFDLTLTGSRPAQIRQARELMTELLADRPFADPARPMRMHFKSFNNWNVNLEFTVIFLNPDLVVVQDYLETVYPLIVERFSQAGIQLIIPPVPSYLPY